MLQNVPRFSFKKFQVLKLHVTEMKEKPRSVIVCTAQDVPGRSVFQQVDHCRTSPARMHHSSVRQKQICIHYTVKLCH